MLQSAHARLNWSGRGPVGPFRIKMDHPVKTLSVPAAGRLYFDLGRNASYEAAKRKEIPVIKIGTRLRVPITALERMLEAATPVKPMQDADNDARFDGTKKGDGSRSQRPN